MGAKGQAVSDAVGARYRRRVIDGELDELFAGLPAIALEGPKAVGKTATALRRATTVHRLDDDGERSILQADPSRLLEGGRPVLIDEWQRFPESFDRVRRAVDDGAGPGSSGSSPPTVSNSRVICDPVVVPAERQLNPGVGFEGGRGHRDLPVVG